jgi:hypothetical protein
MMSRATTSASSFLLLQTTWMRSITRSIKGASPSGISTISSTA